MNVWQRIQKLIKGESSAFKAQTPPPRVPLVDDEPELVVPEITAEKLQAWMAETNAPLVLDVREPYEWRLVRMEEARHLPMNDLPAQVESLPRYRAIVVMCAHGSRSYSVAAWLIEQGFDALSLAGGITTWASRGGAVQQGVPK